MQGTRFLQPPETNREVRHRKKNHPTLSFLRTECLFKMPVTDRAPLLQQHRNESKSPRHSPRLVSKDQKGQTAPRRASTAPSSSPQEFLRMRDRATLRRGVEAGKISTPSLPPPSYLLDPALERNSIIKRLLASLRHTKELIIK